MRLGENTTKPEGNRAMKNHATAQSVPDGHLGRMNGMGGKAYKQNHQMGMHCGIALIRKTRSMSHDHRPHSSRRCHRRGRGTDPGVALGRAPRSSPWRWLDSHGPSGVGAVRRGEVECLIEQPIGIGQSAPAGRIIRDLRIEGLLAPALRAALEGGIRA